MSKSPVVIFNVPPMVRDCELAEVVIFNVLAVVVPAPSVAEAALFEPPAIIKGGSSLSPMCTKTSDTFKPSERAAVMATRTSA